MICKNRRYDSDYYLIEYSAVTEAAYGLQRQWLLSTQPSRSTARTKLVGFPDTAYSLPCYYAETGEQKSIQLLGEMKERSWVYVKTSYEQEKKRLNDAGFKSGVATALCAEFIEVLKYIDGAAAIRRTMLWTSWRCCDTVNLVFRL